MKINNKIVFYFSLLIGVTFIATIYLFFKDSEELASLEVAVMEHPEVTRIWVCGKEIKDISAFFADFKSRSQTKISGSSPLEFYELKILVKGKHRRFFVGKDSENPSLFWLYLNERPQLMIPLAYIDSKTLLNLIGSECRPTKGEWVDVNIPSN